VENGQAGAPPRRAIGYSRVSAGQQVESGLGMDAQRTAIEAEATTGEPPPLSSVHTPVEEPVEGVVEVEHGQGPAGKSLVGGFLVAGQDDGTGAGVGKDVGEGAGVVVGGARRPWARAKSARSSTRRTPALAGSAFGGPRGQRPLLLTAENRSPRGAEAEAVGRWVRGPAGRC